MSSIDTGTPSSSPQPEGTPQGAPLPKQPPGTPVQGDDQSDTPSSSTGTPEGESAILEKEISDSIASMKKDAERDASPAEVDKDTRTVRTDHPEVNTRNFVNSERQLDPEKPVTSEDLKLLIGVLGGAVESLGSGADAGPPPRYHREAGDDGTTNKVFDDVSSPTKQKEDAEEETYVPTDKRTTGDVGEKAKQDGSLAISKKFDPDTKTTTYTAESTGQWGTGSDYRVALQVTAQEIGDDARGAAVSGIEISMHMQFSVKDGIEHIQDDAIENAKKTFRAGCIDLAADVTASFVSLGFSGLGLRKGAADNMAVNGLYSALGSFSGSAIKGVGGVWSGIKRKNVDISKAKLETQSKVIQQETQVIQGLLKNVMDQLAARDRALEAAQQSLAKTGVVN